MSLSYKNMTEMIAKDIAKKRATSKKKKANKNIELLCNNTMAELRRAKEKEYLNHTLQIIKNPTLVIDTFKSDGFSGVCKDFIEPIIDILIKHSFLKTKSKAKLIYKLQILVRIIERTELKFKSKTITKPNPQLTSQTETEHLFKLVA